MVLYYSVLWYVVKTRAWYIIHKLDMESKNYKLSNTVLNRLQGTMLLICWTDSCLDKQSAHRDKSKILYWLFTTNKKRCFEGTEILFIINVPGEEGLCTLETLKRLPRNNLFWCAVCISPVCSTCYIAGGYSTHCHVGRILDRCASKVFLYQLPS